MPEDIKLSSIFEADLKKAAESYNDMDAKNDFAAFQTLVRKAQKEYVRQSGRKDENINEAADAVVAEIKKRFPDWGIAIASSASTSTEALRNAMLIKEGFKSWERDSKGQQVREQVMEIRTNNPSFVSAVEAACKNPADARAALFELNQNFPTEMKKYADKAKGGASFENVMDDLKKDVIGDRSFPKEFENALKDYNFYVKMMKEANGRDGIQVVTVKDLALALGRTEAEATTKIETIEKIMPDKVTGNGEVNINEAAAYGVAKLWKDYPAEMQRLNPGGPELEASKAANCLQDTLVKMQEVQSRAIN